MVSSLVYCAHTGKQLTFLSARGNLAYVKDDSGARSSEALVSVPPASSQGQKLLLVVLEPADDQAEVKRVC